MFEGPLRLAAIICTLFIAASFVLFAVQQTKGASNSTTDQIEGVQTTTTATTPTGAVVPPPATHKRVGQPRRFIDQVEHTLTSPWRSVVSADDDVWIRRIVIDGLGLLIYGLGLGYLARFARGRT